MSPEDLLPAEARARRGQWSPWREAPPVTASDIRRWAMAVYWPEAPPRAFVDLDGRVALVAPRELNPFAWLPGGGGGMPPLPGVRRLFGGCHITYGADITEGDVIRRRSRLEDWTPKVGRLGPMLIVEHTHEWRNQRDEGVRDARYTLVYREAARAAR